MPAVMLVNGPLGYVMTHPASPLSVRLVSPQPSEPLLADVRAAIMNRRSRSLRRAIAQWSFEWIDASVEGVRVLDWETGRETLRLSVLECEALHLLTTATAGALHEDLLTSGAREGASSGRA